jgi:hypothetical protein
MNNFEAASDGQYFPSGQRLIDGNRFQSLVGMEEQVALLAATDQAPPP